MWIQKGIGVRVWQKGLLGPILTALTTIYNVLVM